MPKSKKVTKKSTANNSNSAKTETAEQIQVEITRALLGIVAISIFIIFVINR